MPRNGTIYDLLISCPGDIEEETDVIKEVVEDFNRIHGAINGIQINIKHWEKDSYPEFGDSPQEILNKQFVRDCDAAVAIFWTRFGTPTDKYQSGSEEEIEELISQNKQVFLYFLNKKVQPNKIDQEQYDKVVKFKEQVRDNKKGLYKEVSSVDEFRKSFSNHLSLYFLHKIIDRKEDDISVGNLPKLTIIDSTSDSTDLFLINKFKFNSKNFEKRIEKISSIFDAINSIEIVNKTNKHDTFFSVDVAIDDVQKEAIENFFTEHYNKNIDEYFWNLGNLKRNTGPMVVSLYNQGNQLVGEQDEIKKYELINELYESILNFYGLKNYLNRLESKYYIELAVKNEGKTYDEDIDIKIIIPEGHLCSNKNMPIPQKDFLEEFNYLNIARIIFKPCDSSNIEEYQLLDVENSFNASFINQIYPSKEDINKKEFCKYEEEMKDIFCYKYFEENQENILAFKIKYLKQNTAIYFPSRIIFESPPEFLSYEIRSKHYPNVVVKKVKLSFV